jgi:hypothetical protein
MSESDSPDDNSIDIPNGTPVYGNDKVEVGIDEDGNGYVECKTTDDDPYRFSVPSTEIEEFATIRSENTPPAPTPPEDIIPDDEVEPPDGWTGGNVEHTGGNIWCRIFRKERHDGSYIEVIYNPRFNDGVSAGAYGPDHEWLGEIDTIGLGKNPMETEAISAAEELMEHIDNGEYDYEITSLYDE